MVSLNRTARKPELQVSQEFTTASTVSNNSMRALIIGPNVNTVRFSNTDERENGSVGDWYSDTANKSYYWPNKSVTSLLALDTVKLYFTNAAVKYYSATDDANSNFYLPENSVNVVRCNKAIASSGAYAHDTTLFGSRGLHVGDAITLTSGNQEFTSTIVRMKAQRGGITITPTNGTVSSTSYVTLFSLLDSGLSDLRVLESGGSQRKFQVISVAPASGETTCGLKMQEITGGTTGNEVTLTKTVGTTYVTYKYDTTADADDALGFEFSLKTTEATAIATQMADTGAYASRWVVSYDLDTYGAITEIVLNNNIPTTFVNTASADTTMSGTEIYLIEPVLNIETNYNDGAITAYTITSSQINIKSGIQVPKSLWFSNTADADMLPVYSRKHFESQEYFSDEVYDWGKIYVEYYEYLNDSASNISLLTSAMNIDSAINGPLSPVNPLKYGVYMATQMSGTTSVNYIAVANPNSLASWSTALDKATLSTDSYHIIPLSENSSVLALFVNFVADQSQPEIGHECVTFLPIALRKEKVLVSSDTSTDGNVVTASILTNPEAANSTKNNYIVVPTGNAAFDINGVAIGDAVKLVGQSSATTYNYLVESVVNANTLIVQGSGETTRPTDDFTLTVTHTLVKSEIVQDVVDRAASRANGDTKARVRNVFPGTVLVSNNEEVSSVFASCSIAGLLSSVAYQQGVTAYTLSNLVGTPDTSLLDRDSLTLLSGNGVWVLETDTSGNVYTRHAVTGYDYNELIRREEMFVRNGDNCVKYLRNVLSGIIGTSNLVTANMTLIEARLIAALDTLKARNFTNRLGGQIVSYGNISLAVNSTYRDQLDVSVEVSLPGPLNVVDMVINFSTGV